MTGGLFVRSSLTVIMQMTQFHILISKQAHGGSFLLTQYTAEPRRHVANDEPSRCKTAEIKGFKQRHFTLHIWIFSITPLRLGLGGAGLGDVGEVVWGERPPPFHTPRHRSYHTWNQFGGSPLHQHRLITVTNEDLKRKRD